MSIPALSPKTAERSLFNLFRTSVRNQLAGITILMALVPVLIVSIFIGALTINRSRSTLQANALAQLESVRTIKSSQLTAYYFERVGDVKVTSQNQQTLDALTNLNNGFNTTGADAVRTLYLGKPNTNAGDVSDYTTAHRQFSTYLSNVVNAYNYYDIFLINGNGQVVYTYAKEDDFGSNLVNGKYANTNLALAFQAALKLKPGETAVTDFQFYAPSKNAAAAFTAAPIYSAGQVVGVLAFQLPLDKITAIMQERTGLGTTGETYLVGTDHLFRSESRFVQNSLLTQKVDTQAANSALAGNSGSALITDYRGIPVVSAWQPVKIGDLQWAFIAEIDQSEAFASANQLTTFIVTTISVAVSIILVLALIVSFMAARSFVQPILTLKDAATSVAAGKLDTVITSNRKDELGVLAGAFNSMTSRLRELIGTLEQRVADRTKALTTSSDVSRRLSTILDRKELVTEVVNQINTAFGYYHTQIYFYDAANENLVMAGGTGEAGEKMLAQFHKIAKGRGLVGRAADTNKAVLVPDTSQNPEWLPNPLLPETKSEMAIPIAIGDEVLGVLDVQHNIKDGLRQEDVDLLQSIANQVAVALQNIHQYENTRKIAADMGVVATVGIATSTITDAQKLLQEVVDLSKKSFNLYHAHIYLLNEAGDTLELTAGAGEVGRQMVSEKRKITLDSEQSLVARAARTHEGVVVNDVTLAPDFLPNPLLPDTRSEMAVPMIVAGKVIGVLDVQSETANRFIEIDVSIQTTLASQIAVALQNARSFSEAQRQAEYETTVNLITQKIQSATSVESALQIAARELGHALGMRQTLVELNSTALADDHNLSRALAPHTSASTDNPITRPLDEEHKGNTHE